MPPLLTAAELTDLGKPPADQLRDAVATQTTDDAVRTFARLERGYRNFIDGFHEFTAATREYVLGAHGFAALGALDRDAFRAAVRSAWRVETAPDSAALDTSKDHAGPFRAALEANDIAGALAVFAALEADLRTIHDVAAEQVAACLSAVYRAFGVDELEACIRHCGDRTLLGWMPDDLARPAEVRIRQWARMMLGNFASIRVEETDDAFVITQDPCGTCSRQVLAGRYDEPDGFAVVVEPHRITWDRGGVPVYRTHVAVMHDLMPLERIGQRWPEISCPQGLDAGPCRVVLRKKPGP
ncbi:MAG TPA: hypothetical protein VGQ20_17210 [Acidimicrobiales bacterium]|jgi:hypothetical protein|nr:hypothetical protein [Acidimicrobiales bacterium]